MREARGKQRPLAREPSRSQSESSLDDPWNGNIMCKPARVGVVILKRQRHGSPKESKRTAFVAVSAFEAYGTNPGPAYTHGFRLPPALDLKWVWTN